MMAALTRWTVLMYVRHNAWYLLPEESHTQSQSASPECKEHALPLPLQTHESIQ